MHDHQVQFYEREAFLLEGLSDFIGSGLDAGQASIVIATQAHREALEQMLRARGASWDAALRSDRYVALDAAETLATFMVGGQPDKRRFNEVITDLLRRMARNGSRQVLAFGEMVALLWAEGKHRATVQLEEMWDDLVRTESISLLCAYPLQGFNREEHAPLFQHICNAHSRVRLAESAAPPSAPEKPRGGDLAHLARSREVMARQTARMTRRVEDLLEISRLTRGKVRLRNVTVPLSVVVHPAVELVRPLVDERRHRLTVDLPAGSITLFGDAARLVQIVANLLYQAANSLKPGGNISLSARRDGADLLLSVRDDGARRNPKVGDPSFEASVQLPDALEDVLGIGLPMIRILVELHGGSLEALSERPGLGREVVVRLPLD